MKKIISFIKRKILRNKQDRWDYKYAKGNWQTLHKEDERFDEVIRLVKNFSDNPSILEIGCGEAVMFLKMKDLPFSFFRGVDISKVAIAKAKKEESDIVKFEVADMETYRPYEQYDVIVFNESLYYSKAPDKVVIRIADALKENGLIIISAVDNKYTAHLWNCLERLPMELVASTIAQADGHTWNIKAFKL